jgi:hypothetical protein
MHTFNGRARRPEGAPTTLLQARTSPEARELASRAAQLSGVTFSYYVDALLLQVAELNGGELPLVDAPLPQHDQLPIDELATPEGDRVAAA